MYKKNILYLISIPLVISLILTLSIEIWDKVFLIGLILFMIGGTVQIIKIGVYDNFFRISKELYKKMSKLEGYVSEKDIPTATFEIKSNHMGLGNYILLTGIIIILISTAFSYYLS